MLEKLRRGWKDLAHGKPGDRFQAHYRNTETSRSPWHRWLMISAGVALMAIGVVLLPAPGPGILVIALGAAVVAQESEWAAGLLDGFELWCREALSRIRRRGKKRPARA